jgi:hypothetical protein
MALRTWITAGALALAAGQLSAQATNTTALETAKKTWTGLWEGPAWHIGESNPIGGYRLEIAHDTAWKVAIDVVTGQTMSMRGIGFTPDGNRAKWSSPFGGDACATTATIDGDILKGETRCGEHGGLVFELRKKTR